MDTPKKVTRSIVVEINEGSNDYTVREGERSCPGLCWDEMLGTIAELTHPLLGSARYRLRTPAEEAAHQEWLAGRRTAQNVPTLALPAPHLTT